MSLLPRLRFGKDRERETEALEHRISALQMALKQCGEVAARWTEFRRTVTAAIAVLMLALGFTLGVYLEPIKQSVTVVAQAVGFVKSAPTDDPYAAYQKGKYATALQLVRPLADEGDARAESLLGLLYYRGRGVPQDYTAAVTWFRRAAGRGDATAQLYLGIMYSEGQGVPQDHAEAAKWYLRAADQDEPLAQYNLGLLYSGDEVTERDNVRAYMWLNLAAAHFPASDSRRVTAVAQRELLSNRMTQDQIAEAQRLAREWKPK
jgi:TPR repeat protein